MTYIKRITLFLMVNLGVLALLSLLASLFGITPYLQSSGLSLGSLLLYAAVMGFAGSIISLLLSKTMAKRTFKIQLISQPQSSAELLVYSTVQHIARKEGITMPEVGIYPSAEVNAFATGYNRNKALVAVSQGLLDTMSPDEIEGVLGHEMAHILNGDMVTMTLLQGVVNTFVIFIARVIAYLLTAGRENANSGAFYGISMVAELCLGLIASLIVRWYSRRREYAADAGSALFLGRDKMLSALKRLKDLQRMVDTRQPSFATLKISDRPNMFSRLFSTHPDIADRIAALEGYQR
ncbi:protease HtpX [Candidatus Peribacteria bacterium]|nr:protease HtpX [Candidatus Peribacteria bacterium]